MRSSMRLTLLRLRCLAKREPAFLFPDQCVSAAVPLLSTALGTITVNKYPALELNGLLGYRRSTPLYSFAFRAVTGLHGPLSCTPFWVGEKMRVASHSISATLAAVVIVAFFTMVANCTSTGPASNGPITWPKGLTAMSPRDGTKAPRFT